MKTAHKIGSLVKVRLNENESIFGEIEAIVVHSTGLTYRVNTGEEPHMEVTDADIISGYRPVTRAEGKKPSKGKPPKKPVKRRTALTQTEMALQG